MGPSGVVFNIQRYSVDDGPGVRSTVFLKGCPLRCLWCSNPESQNPWPEVVHKDSACTRCGRCVEVCEPKAVAVDETGVRIDRGRCTRCGKCVEVCLPQALRMMGREMSVDEVFDEVVRDMDYYRTSGGGVTVSGGEVLDQAEFAVALLRRCREAGIHTCADTSGYADQSALARILPYTSLVFFDVKLVDPARHRRWTGCSNELILQNLAYVAERGTPLVVRVPVVPGANDAPEDITAMARAVAGITESAKVHLLPYHRFGMGKYKMLDRGYELEELRPPADADLQALRAVVESFGLACEVVV